MKGLRHPWVLRIAAWMLGAAFLVAAIPKIADPPGFAEALHAYTLVPAALLAPIALALPWLEGLIALALISGLARRSAALLASFLLLVFMAALAINLWRGHPVDCGCFGIAVAVRTAAERLTTMRWDLLRDAGLLILGMLVLRGPVKDLTA